MSAADPRPSFVPAHELARRVRAGELAPLEAVDAALARIEALDSQVGAFTELRADGARAEARALAERTARGVDPGPLAGIPIGVKDMEDVAFTFPFNLTGHPAASVRAGYGDDGLPVGLQIIAPRHRDDLVFQAAHAYEQARPWNDRWPELG